jgi:hypothetical protein
VNWQLPSMPSNRIEDGPGSWDLDRWA